MEVEKHMEENITLATEILHELKKSAKRWFIAFITVLILWFASIGAFIWYISLPIEVTDKNCIQSSNHSSGCKFIGGNYNNGSETGN